GFIMLQMNDTNELVEDFIIAAIHFFFSSRRRHTRFDCDWSSDVCSSDLPSAHMEIIGRRHYGRKAVPAGGGGGKSPTRELLETRSEERRVGKECRSRWSPYK